MFTGTTFLVLSTHCQLVNTLRHKPKKASCARLDGEGWGGSSRIMRCGNSGNCRSEKA